MAEKRTDWRRYLLKLTLCCAAATIAHVLWRETAAMPLFVGMVLGWWGGEVFPTQREGAKSDG